jgi:XTP/dITP diphosphohydrolase
MTRRVVLATANPDKAGEIAEILRRELGDDVEVVPRPEHVPDVVEDGDTLEANARLKADAIAAAVGPDRGPVVADDTGLEVDALGGGPGVRSARFAGEDATYRENVVKLIDALAELPDPQQRRARFRTVAIAVTPDGAQLVAEGTVDGTIALAPRGSNGFGYDSVFIPDSDVGDGRTFAEMSAAEKHARSHRGRAFRALAVALQRREGSGGE